MQKAMRVLLLAVVVALAWSNAGMAAAPPIQRAYAAGHFMLELDGTSVGFVSAVEGGLPFGDVVKEPGEEFFVKKRIGDASYRDIRLEFGPDMDPSFYNWISTVLQGQEVRLNGAIVAANFNFDAISRLEFQGALITEVTFPALDGSSKEPAKMSIVLTPKSTSLNRKVSGKVASKSSKAQKRWLSSGFRLSIDGLTAATARVTKIDALTIKLGVVGGGGEGEGGDALKMPAQIDFPNLVVTVSEPADQIHDWFNDFVIQANSDDSQEKSGTLDFLAPDRTTVLFTLTFKGLGIFSLESAQNDAGAAAIPRIVAEIYCEKLEFQAR